MSEGFIDPEDFDNVLAVVDRSSLERNDVCPAQARFVADKRVITSSHLTDTGSAIHDALGSVLTEYVESRGQLGVVDLADTVMQLLCASRADVQQDAISAMRPSVWAWAKYVHSLHPDNILRFDGGEGERCGQLAWDIPDLKVRVTSEVDFIHGGKAKEVITEIDYKSGNKVWTAADVEHSFQFAMHAWLGLENYPEVEAYEVRIWNTRKNSLTYRTVWERRDLYELQYRIRSSVQNWLKHRDVAPEKSRTWPTVEKCSLCPAAALCPAVPDDIRTLSDPHTLVDTLVAAAARVDELKKMATAIVRESGRDIVTPSGNAFGIGKPKAMRRPTLAMYSVSGDDDGGSGEEGG